MSQAAAIIRVACERETEKAPASILTLRIYSSGLLLHSKTDLDLQQTPPCRHSPLLPCLRTSGIPSLPSTRTSRLIELRGSCSGTRLFVLPGLNATWSAVLYLSLLLISQLAHVNWLSDMATMSSLILER